MFGHQCYVVDLLRVSEEKYPSKFGEFSTSSRASCVENMCVLPKTCLVRCYI
jgi:hypothetical protein